MSTNMTEHWKYTLIREGGKVDVYQANTFFRMVIEVLKGKIRRSMANWKQ